MDIKELLPNINVDQFQLPNAQQLGITAAGRAPRFLLLYGSLRQRSFSRLAVEEAQRLLEAMGAQCKIFNPSGLPLPDDDTAEHPKVQELRELANWSDGHVWCSPERHGAMTGIMKAQIDWLPLSSGAISPTQGKTLAGRQVCGGSQSCNVVATQRCLSRLCVLIRVLMLN